ncbi:MAG: PAS domain S-box protein [Candidatus Competibacteraceae bacterium]|nr:PAS domain S-box protein [Candidatus Competibacteraceae bacterium]
MNIKAKTGEHVGPIGRGEAIAADAIVSIDERQNIKLFNAGAERIFGYSAAEAMGRPLEMLLPERFRADHAGHMRRFASSGVASRQMGERQEIFGRRKSGDEFPAEASISILTVGSKPTFTVVLRDVSQRKSAEDLLKRSEERTRLAVEEGRIGLFEHDHDAGTSFGRQHTATCSASIQTRSLTLRPTSAQSTLKIGNGRGCDFQGAGSRRWRRVQRRPPDCLVRIGSTRWVSVNSRTHFASIDGQRHAQRTIGAARDITETKIFEAGLELRVAERTAELLAVLDAVPDAIVTIDTAFHLLRANAALPKLFGHDRSNISSLTLNTLFATAQDEAAVMEAWTVGDGQGSKSMTTVNCRRTDGSTFPAMVHGRPVRTREGHVVSHVVLIRDLSDELSRREKLSVRNGWRHWPTDRRHCT